MQKASKIVTVVLLCAFLALFAFYVMNSTASPLGIFAAALSLGLFGACTAFVVPRFFTAPQTDEALSPNAALGPRSARFSRAHPWAQIVIAVLVSRLFLFLLAWLLSTLVYGYKGGIWDTLQSLWLRSDSPSYLGLAERWYVTEGDPRFHIVFFPFYPVLIRVFSYITGGYFSSAMLVSTLCASAAAVYFYELCALDMPRKGALRAVKYLFLLPAAFFFAAPMTESLFLLICVASMYYLRKKRVFVSCILAAVAGFTRSAGILLFIPIVIEGVTELAALRRAGEKAAFKKNLIKRLACLFIVPLGLLGYLYINYAVWGDPLKFMEVQRDHWGQGIGFFFNSAAYQTDYAVNAAKAGDTRLLWTLFVPNLIASFAALGVMVYGAKKLRPSYTLYFLGYFAFSIGATWLLSAPRYLAAAFPLPIVLSALTENKRADIPLTLLLFLAQCAYLGAYVLGGAVY
ncbi:MAG TPA: mannosyltransferase family protein [Clostridia bacterium]|nr:mannosyltransferase family protein [Clostridia bacterium]